MKYWVTYLYGYKTTLGLMRVNTPLNIKPATCYWYWRLCYTGFACDELYSRIIEHVSRHILIVPAICLYDKHLSSFMNATAITKLLSTMNNKIFKENLSPIESTRLLIWVSLSMVLLVQVGACL